MTVKYHIVLILIIFLASTEAANILVVLPMASPSHHVLSTPYVIELAKRGHNVTVVSPFAQKTKVPNLTDLAATEVVEEIHEEFNADYDYEDFTDTPPFLSEYIIFDILQNNCLKMMKSEAWKKLMNYPSDTLFDVIILEAATTECLMGSLRHFGTPPIILWNGFMVSQWMFEMLGSPNIVSVIPHYSVPYSDKMSFTQRFMNLLHNAADYILYNYWVIPKMDKAAKEHFGPQTPSFRDAWDKISLGFANFHPVLDYPWAKTPNLIPIAGIQVRQPKPLPEDIKKFLDEATDGAIFFSLGTNVLSKNISPQKMQAILDTFAELPQKVLWKFELDSLPGLPKNVKIGKWLPQSDILAHPNVKLFISHSGYLSTVESVYRAVPVVGIPIFADQPKNIQKLVDQGAALRVNYNELTKDKLKEAINTVLFNSSYSENMKVLSERLKDNPESPLERAVFWTEYVIRHKGAPHLRPAALDLNMAQYLLLDVIAFVLAIPLLIVTLFYFLCCRRKSKDNRKLKKN